MNSIELDRTLVISYSAFVCCSVSVALLLLSCLLLSVLLWSFLNSSWLLCLGVLFCCYRSISSLVFIYSFIP